MSAYTKFTLNDNWFEERAPELKGVLPDYGFREMGTTTAATHIRPGAVASHSKIGKRGLRVGMVCVDTLAEAQIAWAGGEPSGHTFGAVIATHPPDAEARYMATTAQTSFKKPVRRPEDEHKTGPKAAAAMYGLRPNGEVLNLGNDPQRNTAVQRAWLYGKDPMLKTLESKPAPPQDTSYMSAPIGVDSTLPEAKPRKAIMTLTSDELSRRPGQHVWADEATQQ